MVSLLPQIKRLTQDQVPGIDRWVDRDHALQRVILTSRLSVLAVATSALQVAMDSSEIEFADSLLISGISPLEPPSSLVFSSSVCNDQSNGYDFWRKSSRNLQAEKPKAGNLNLLAAENKKMHFEGTAQTGSAIATACCDQAKRYE